MSGFWLREILGLVAGYCFDCRSISATLLLERLLTRCIMLASTLYVDGTASSSFTLATIVIPGFHSIGFSPTRRYIDASSVRRGRACGLNFILFIYDAEHRTDRREVSMRSLKRTKSLP